MEVFKCKKNNKTSKNLDVRSTVRLRFRKSISRHHFQTIRKLANTDFQYHRGVIYSIYQYILTKMCFFPYEMNFTLIYGPYSCLIIVFFGPIFMEVVVLFQMLAQF